MRDLARRLLTAEAARQRSTGAPVHAAVRVCARLQVSLIRFAGLDGFTSLLRRALVLARLEVPALQTVKLNPDGSLEGLDDLAADATENAFEAGVAIVANLLELLVTFVGEPIAIRLVREVWPEASSVG